MSLEILRDLKYVGLCRICNGALWLDSYFGVYKNGSEDHICENDMIYHNEKQNGYRIFINYSHAKKALEVKNGKEN